MCVLALFFPAAEVVPAAETDPNKKMTILINVEQPDIILVEAMDDINCLALILNVRIDFHEVDRILSHFNDFVVFFRCCCFRCKCNCAYECKAKSK